MGKSELSLKDQYDKEYSDEQFDLDYPERLIPCRQCGKKFPTRFDARYCSDKCFNTMVRELRKKEGTWIKAKDRMYVKSSHRPDKNWKAKEIEIP